MALGHTATILFIFLLQNRSFGSYLVQKLRSENMKQTNF